MKIDNLRFFIIPIFWNLLIASGQDKRHWNVSCFNGLFTRHLNVIRPIVGMLFI